MVDHGTFIFAAYSAAAIILAWCAIAPIVRTRRVRTLLARALETRNGDGQE